MLDFEVGREYSDGAGEFRPEGLRAEPGKNYLSNKDESVPLFRNKYIEKLTKVHPITPLVIFCPVIAYLLWRSIFVFSVSLFLMSALIACGILCWTLFEYAVHRFVFHFETKQEGLLQELQFLFHGVHHAYPKDSRRLVMPPSVSIPLGLLIYFAASKVWPEKLLPSFFTGFVFGYLCYDMIHFAIHHFSFSNKTFRKIKRQHYLHHYSNKENGFGVSSPLWDYIFRT